MPLDLPNTPLPGDSYVLADGSEVVWDGEKWAPPSAAYLPIAGGTMLGPILLEPPYPLNQYEAGHKQYIDEMIMAQSLYQGLWQVAANIPDLDPAVALPLAGYSWLAQTEDQNVPELAPANLPGIGGQPINAGDSVRWNAQAAIYERVRGASMGSVEAMLMFLQLAGGRMRGRLILNDGSLTDTHEAVPKWYVDQLITTAGSEADLRFVNVGGDTMTGMLFLPNDPTVDLHSATKRYVDQSIAAISLFQGVWFVAANNPDLTPAVALPEHTYSWIAQTVNPNVPETAPAGLPGIAGLTIAAGDHVVWNATTSLYVHIRGASLNSVEARAVFIEAAGDSMTGVLNLAADPVGDMEAVNKRYLDAQVAGGLDQAEADLLYVSGVTAGPGLSGGGTAGDITLSLVQATQAAIGGGLIATSGEISSGTADTPLVSPLGLRGQLGADASILYTTAKTVVPSINEVISTIAAMAGVLVFAGAYNAETNQGYFNGNVGIPQGPGPLPAPSATNYGAYLLVTYPGLGGGPNEPAAAMEVQDWLVSDGAVWILVKFGPASTAFLPLTGGTMQGFITLHSDPTANMHAATKAYVDNSTLSQAEADALYLTQAEGDLAYVNIAGDVMTGFLTLNADPTAPLHAATRSYVDSRAVVQATQTLLGGGEIATAVEIAAGALDTHIVSPLGLRSQLGADSAILYTTAKTVVPAINELISTLAALAGTLVFAGAYDAATSLGQYNGNAGIAQGQGPLPAPSVANTGAYLLVVMPGAGGGANEPAGAIEIQDWLVSDGTIWNLIKFGPTAVAFLPLSGGLMSGFITLHADPTAPMHAANRAYVDAALGSAGMGTITGVTAGTALSGGGTTGTVTLNAVVATNAQIAAGTDVLSLTSPAGLRSQLGADGAILYTTAKTVVPAINELISTLAAMAGVLVFAGAYDAQANTGIFNGNAGIAEGQNLPLPAPSATNHGAYLLVVMPGPGGGPNEPAGAMEVQDWLISDGAIWNLVKFGPTATAFLPTTGGTMTGYINLHADPTAAMHPVTLQYLQANSLDQAEADALYLTPAEGDLAYVRLAGSTMTGHLTLNAAPVNALHAATKAYVDGAVGGAGGGTITGVTAGTGLTGGGLTGTVTLALDTAYADGRFVNVAGDTMTGGLTGTDVSVTGSLSGNYIWCGGDIDAVGAVSGSYLYSTTDAEVTQNLYVGGAIYMGATAAAYIWAAPNYMVFRSFGTGIGGYYFGNGADIGLATLNDMGLALNGRYVFLGGGGGSVNTTGGPFIYGDTNYMVFKAGSADLGFMWQDYAGAQTAALTRTGILVLNGTGVIYGGVGEIQSIAFNWDGTQLGLWVDGGYVNLLTLGGGAVTNYVAKTGDVMTGSLSSPNFYIQAGTAAVPTSAAITIGARDGSAQWTYYATGDTLRWYTGLADRLQLTNQGNLTVSNAFQAALITSTGGCNSSSVGTSYINCSGNIDVTGNVTTNGLVVSSVYGVNYAGIGDTDWVAFGYNGTSNELGVWLNGAWWANLAHVGQLGAYLPLTGGTIYGALSVTLDIYSAQQIYCAGNMSCSTLTGAAVNSNGNMSCAGTVYAGAVSSNNTVAAAGTVSGGYLYSSGNIDAVGTIGAGAIVSWGGVNAGANINATGIIHADYYVSTNSYYYIAGALFAAYTNASALLSIYAGGTGMQYFYLSGTTYYDNNQHSVRTNGGGVAYCLFNGAGSYNQTAVWYLLSSADYKENIQPYDRGLEALLALQPVTYYNRAGATPFADESNSGILRYGFVAEEVEPYIPEMVGTTSLEVVEGGEQREFTTLAPGHLVYVLTNAVKELAAMNDALSARIAALEGVA